MKTIVTCGQCISRRAEVAAAGKHAIRASELFRVGNIMGVSENGHAMYFTTYGVMSLCATERLVNPMVDRLLGR